MYKYNVRRCQTVFGHPGHLQTVRHNTSQSSRFPNPSNTWGYRATVVDTYQIHVYLTLRFIKLPLEWSSAICQPSPNPVLSPVSPMQVADEDIRVSLLHSLPMSKRLRCCSIGEGRGKKQVKTFSHVWNNSISTRDCACLFSSMGMV